MPKETKVKHGDTVTVTVKRSKRGRAASAKPDDRRYGPPPIEDEKKRLVRPQIVYLFDGTGFGYNPSGEITERWYLPEEVEFPDVGGFVDPPAVAAATRYSQLGRTVYYAPELIEDTFKLRVKNPDTGNFFKTIFLFPPLTKPTSDILGMNVRIGTKDNFILAANPDYKANRTPAQRLVAVEAQIAAGSTPELIEKRDNIQLEIDELQPADYSAKLRWDNDYREYAVPEAYLSAKPTGKTWEILTTGIYFEPFNPFDTDNFYVTEGAFGDLEIPAPKLNGKDTLFVLLEAQNWQTTATLDYYERGGDNVVRHKHYTLLQDARAIIGPVPGRVVLEPGSYAREFYPGTIPQYDPIHVLDDAAYLLGGFERVIPTIPSGLTFGSDATPERSVVGILGFPGLGGLGGAPQLASNCHNKVETANSYVERYCGSFLFKEINYNVYRKTVKVKPATVVIYDGRVDSASNVLGTVVTGENLDYAWFDTFYPAHTNLDLGNFTDDFRL